MPRRSSSSRIQTFRPTIRFRSCTATLLGGTVGGPIIKDKLFGFLSYQHLHVSDQEIGDSLPRRARRPERRPLCQRRLADLANNSFGDNIGNPNVLPANIDHNALVLFNSPALPGEPGKWLIPNDGLRGAPPTCTHLDNAFIPGTGRFKADLAVADLDYNATKKDTLA